MWWEILPSFGILVGLMAIPQYGTFYLHKAVLDNGYRRDMSSRWDRNLYTRDRRLCGDPYKTPGLEAIPDN
ncbi:NADH dehydrogenase [ubiquinone] 1 alpha subcomplex subunit 1 [Athalia rosae]|uniref:NADH dehydrogenase [ubiquinone] 1 alpha subcomplex subunit 1 n=1 Tax=Athalia rosae TaxID=37344 RepID=UPI0020342871|nr:NADH dehydrogenase [ubiquinone] 1 alpha subcomplex subunit 1 [Athalia rosae]